MNAQSRKMSVSIPITDEQFSRAGVLARQTIALFRRRWGHYTNNYESHLRGKVGEVAVSSWLHAQGIELEEVFADLSRMRG